MTQLVTETLLDNMGPYQNYVVSREPFHLFTPRIDPTAVRKYLDHGFVIQLSQFLHPSDPTADRVNRGSNRSSGGGSE